MTASVQLNREAHIIDLTVTRTKNVILRQLITFGSLSLLFLCSIAFAAESGQPAKRGYSQRYEDLDGPNPATSLEFLDRQFKPSRNLTVAIDGENKTLKSFERCSVFFRRRSVDRYLCERGRF